MIPPKSYEPTPDLAADAEGATRSCSTSARSASAIGYPLFMKPYDGGGWRAVTRVNDEAALRTRYEESGKGVMHLQAAVQPFDSFVRCIGLGPQTHLVRYDPDAPLHDRYTQDTDFVSDEEAQLLRDTTLTINAFFGWDFNSCESLRKDGVWYPIDFANPCPDSQVTSLHRHFPWLVKANLRWSIFCAVTKRPMRRTLDWEPFYEIAAKRPAVSREAARVREDRRRALRDRAVRGVLREAPAAPRRGRLGVLRHAGREGRGPPEGHRAVPDARGRAVHRAVLEPHPGVARRTRKAAVMGDRGRQESSTRWRQRSRCSATSRSCGGAPSASRCCCSRPRAATPRRSSASR